MQSSMVPLFVNNANLHILLDNKIAIGRWSWVNNLADWPGLSFIITQADGQVVSSFWVVWIAEKNAAFPAKFFLPGMRIANHAALHCRLYQGRVMIGRLEVDLPFLIE